MSRNTHRTWHTLDALQRYAHLLGFGQICYKNDNETGLRAFIAIHNTDRGPAIGGCRITTYTSANYAMKDALRLAYMMTLKAAVVNLPHGGAKAVIMQPKQILDRQAYFESFGEFVHDMNGRYISAMDVGTTTDDMDAIATKTPYVIGAAKLHAGQGDPAPYTGLGIFRGMEAAIQHQLKRQDFEGLHVVFQGAGRVAYQVMKNLHQQGAKISVYDINPEAVERCVQDFQAQALTAEKIFETPCDIFAPCALGGTLDHDNILKLQCKIIAGAANNQLAHKKYIKLIMKKNILYAPDFVINAGGLINASSMYRFNDPTIGNKEIDALKPILLKIFATAEKTGLPTNEVAEQIAKENLSASKQQAQQGKRHDQRNNIPSKSEG